MKTLEARFPNKKLIFIMDRGYFSWKIVLYCCRHGLYFIIRMKKNVFMNHTGGQYVQDCGDLTQTLDLTNSKKKDVLNSLEHPFFVSRASLDLQDDSGEHNQVTVRDVTSALDPETAKKLKEIDQQSDDGEEDDYSFTYLCTNIPEEEMSCEEISIHYFSRWGTEIAFGLLKHKIGLINLHSKSENKIRQEIWMSLMRYNMCCLIMAELSEIIDSDITRRSKSRGVRKKSKLAVPERAVYVEPEKAAGFGSGYNRKISFSTVSRCLADYMYGCIGTEDIVNEVADNLVYTIPGRHECRGNTIHHFRGFQWHFD